MADEEFGGLDDDGGGSGKKPLNLKLIIIIVVLLVVGGAAGFFGSKMLSKGGGDKGTDVKKEDAAKAGEEKKEVKSEEKSGEEGAKTEEGTVKEGEKKGEEGKEATPGTPTTASTTRGVLPIEAFTVNLNDPFGRRYAEVELKVVLNKKELVDKIKNDELIMPKIRNEILMTLSAKSYNDLRTVAGKVTLLEEIQMRLNEILKQELGVEPVLEVLQTKFLMQ